VSRAPLLQTVHWFLNGHARWAGNTIRLYANALEQEVAKMLEYDTFEARERLLLRGLKNDRPSPITKIKTKKANKSSISKKWQPRRKKAEIPQIDPPERASRA
jgi:hypothetical protein